MIFPAHTHSWAKYRLEIYFWMGGNVALIILLDNGVNINVIFRDLEIRYSKTSK